MKSSHSNSVAYTLLLVLMFWTGAARGQIIFVSQDATGDGSSWQNATGDLRAALDAAVAGEEIWISGGTYTPTICSPCTSEDRDVRFVLPKGVKLRGGFEGSENAPSERIAPNTTPDQGTEVILSGQIEQGVDSTRSFTVLEAIAPTNGTLVERIKLTNGLADNLSQGRTSRRASGALMHVATFDTLQKMELEIRNCSFLGGEAIGYGGGLFVDADYSKQAEILMAGCNFSNNTAQLGGGGIIISASYGGTDNSTIEQTNFTSNFAGEDGGGGILIRSAQDGTSNTQVISCDFTDNTSIFGDGGALHLYGKEGLCSPTITNCSFTENKGHFGGAITINASYGGLSEATLNDCQFSENESSNAGGALFVTAVNGGVANYQLYRSRFSNNLSGESGGAVLTYAIEGSSRPLYRDCSFLNNTATLYGGAVYNLGKAGVASPTFINCTIANNQASSAGGVYCLGSEGGESSPTILNCVFSGNQANVGGALYSNANDSTGTAEPFVANTVFFNNSAANGRTLRIIYGRPHLLNCFIDEEDCESLNSGFGGEPVCLGGNIFSDEQSLFDASNPLKPFIPLAGGPLVDAGNDSILIANGIFRDIEESTRFRGSASEIGIAEVASDPILLEVLVDSSSVTACEGTSVTLNATFTPPYPSGEINWVINSNTVSTGSSYTIDALASNSLEVSATVFGESTTSQVALNAIPTIHTSLTLDTSNLPDTLCIDSTYLLEATVEAPGGSYSVQWLDENEATLATTENIFLTPSGTGTLFRKVVIAYEGACLDTTARSTQLEYPAISCMVSSARQTIDSKRITVFPNPVREVLSIQGMSEGSQFTAQIHNSTGQLVYSGTMSAFSTSINISALPQGLYAITVSDEQTIFRTLIEKF